MKKLLFTGLLSLLVFSIKAQLFIDNSYTLEEMVMDFFDNSCVSPSNISSTGTEESIAFFDAGGTDLGVMAGIFISTGNVFDAIGPNDGSATGTAMGISGDTDLDALLGAVTYDGVTIEMDILSSDSILNFSYVFASEEYPEFVGSAFNDVFAFYMSGPGLSGKENIALVPGTTQPVAINNINSGMNANYYIDNTDGQLIEFDGYTTEMQATVKVIPNETYQVKIVVADAMDAIFDSGIFLGIESLCGSGLLPISNNLNVSVDDLTATVGNSTKYAKSYFWDFGDGYTSTEKFPDPHTYNQPGNYTVTLITNNFCCSDTSFWELEVGSVSTHSPAFVKPYSFGPNPLQDVLNISMDDEKKAIIRIFNALGENLWSGNVIGDAVVDLSTFPHGLYLMEINIAEKTYVEKLIRE